MPQALLLLTIVISSLQLATGKDSTLEWRPYSGPRNGALETDSPKTQQEQTETSSQPSAPGNQAAVQGESAPPSTTLKTETSSVAETNGQSTDASSAFRKWIRPHGEEKATDNLATETAEPVEVARRFRLRRPLLRSADRVQEEDVAESAVATDVEASEELSAPEPESDEGEAEVSRPEPQLPPLSRGQINLRNKIRRVLSYYEARPLNTRDRSPWEVMHALLAFEVHSKVLQANGKPITAAGWLCYNKSCKRRTLMYVNEEGKLRVRVGPALQGHHGQLLAMLAQAKIKRTYPMLVEGHELTIEDLIRMEMDTCYPRSELTFKLIGLMHYLKSDTTWVNDQGMEWDLPRLVSEELNQPIRGAACGGTHRLSGLTLAYKTRQRRDEPVDGVYRQAQQFVRRYQQYAYRLQNSDGSLSTEWFRGPGSDPDIDRRLKTTGHILEWLLYAATEKELHYWRTQRAVNYLANLMWSNRNHEWDSGGLGHAIHALYLYDKRVFKPYDETPLAEKQNNRVSREQKSNNRRRVH